MFSYFIFGLFELEAVGTKIPIIMVDEDQSSYSRMLIELLQEEPYLEVLEKDLDTALLDLQENRVEGVYGIQEGFEEDIRRDRIPQLFSYTSPIAPGGGALGEVIISRSIRILSSARAANIIVSLEEEGELRDVEGLWQRSFEKAESYWEPEPLMTLSLEEVSAREGRGEGEGESLTLGPLSLLTGPRGMMILYSTLFSLWIYYRRREEVSSGVYKRQELVVGKFSLALGKYTGDFLFLTIHHLLLMLSIYYFQGLGLRGDLIHHILLILVIQGLLIGLWTVLSKLTLGKGLMVIGLPIAVIITSMTSGALWSIELLPREVQRIALLTPQGIYLQGVELSYLGDEQAFYLVLLWGCALGLLLQWVGYRKKVKE